MRVDREYREVATDDMGCTLFGQLNGVKVHKMRWLGNVSIDKELDGGVMLRRRLTGSSPG